MKDASYEGQPGSEFEALMMPGINSYSDIVVNGTVGLWAQHWPAAA